MVLQASVGYSAQWLRFDCSLASSKNGRHSVSQDLQVLMLMEAPLKAQAVEHQGPPLLTRQAP